MSWISYSPSPTKLWVSSYSSKNICNLKWWKKFRCKCCSQESDVFGCSHNFHTTCENRYFWNVESWEINRKISSIMWIVQFGLVKVLQMTSKSSSMVKFLFKQSFFIKIKFYSELQCFKVWQLKKIISRISS